MITYAGGRDPREVPRSDFDGDLLFDAEGLRCHMTGVTPVYPRLLGTLTGADQCIDVSGIAIQEGQYILSSQSCS
jgi:hypothetical protein